MQSQEHAQNVPAVERNGAVLQHALKSLQTGAVEAAAGTQRVVRQHPFASLAVALGAGIAVGAAAYWLLAPKPSLRQRVRRLF